MTNGRLLAAELPIAVDYWQLPKSYEKFKTYLYFLTHLHTDHTKGLTSTWTETIYTSKINRELVITMLKVRPELVKPLEIGVGYTLTLPTEHKENAEYLVKTITVTPIDANHIKGSVMYLFEGSFGRLLYTGDFRWCNNMMKNPILKELAETRSLNLLYVDNTFEDADIDFPSREECVNEVLRIVKKYQYHRIIFGCQTIGKEEVLLKAANYRNEKVYVPEQILKIYEVLGLPLKVFTTNQADSLLWFEKLIKISQFDLRKKNLEMPTIAIKLTASGLLHNVSKQKDDDELVFTVPYSNHSSPKELSKCLEFLQPKLVERIVTIGANVLHTSSVIDKYLAAIKQAEMTDDDTFSYADSMEISDVAPFKSQMPNYFHSANGRGQQALEITEDETLESDDYKVVSPSVPVASTQTPSSLIESRNDAMANASKIISSIHSDLDKFKDEYIYTEEFINKLISLHKIYQPITGISFNI